MFENRGTLGFEEKAKYAENLAKALHDQVSFSYLIYFRLRISKR